MPLEPPPTRITQDFLDSIRTYTHVDGWLMKDKQRNGLHIMPGNSEWIVSPRGERRITKSTFTMLCNSTVGPNGGFVERSGTDEQTIETMDMSPEFRWNLLAVPVDLSAYYERNITAKQIRKH